MSSTAFNSSLVPVSRARRSDRVLVGLLFLVSFISATIFAQSNLRTRTDEEPRVGAHVARGHGFRSSLDPSPNAELTAWVPPGYPLVCAGVYRVLGVESVASTRVLAEINVICFSLLVVGVFHLGRMLFWRNVGLLGAVLVMIHPLFLLRTNYLWHTYIVLAMLVWILVAALRVQRSGSALWQVALLGAALGVLIQFNASLLFGIPIVIYLAMRDRSVGKKLSGIAISMAAFALMILPWTIRNYVEFDRIMYLRRGAALELWVGNLPGSNGWQELSKHPSVYPPEHQLMRRLGEEKYIELSRQRFMENHKSGMWPFYQRSLKRAWFLFVGPVSSDSVSMVRSSGWRNVARVGLDWIVLVLAVGGWLLAWRCGYRCLWMIPLIFTSAFPHIFTHMSYRYSMPAKALMLLMGSFLVLALWSRLKCGAWPRKSAMA